MRGGGKVQADQGEFMTESSSRSANSSTRPRPSRSKLPHEVLIASLGGVGSTPEHRILDTTFMQGVEARNLFDLIDETAPSTAELARRQVREYVRNPGRSKAYAIFYRRAFEQAYAAGLRGLPSRACRTEMPL